MTIVGVNEHELLLRHAANWARDRNRQFDSELVEIALELRSHHDDLAAGKWPAGSAEHLMLVRWPAHGPVEPPDVDALVESLHTFWGFLRSTGRMSAASAQPAQLRREARRAAPKMAAACADQTRFGTAKQILDFGSEMGINLDDVPDMDEANRRLQQIVEAWNAQPDEERLARSQHWPGPGRSLERELLDAADANTVPDLPIGLDSSVFSFSEAGELLLPEPLDREASAAQAQESPFLKAVLALAEWVGDGKPITSTETLRPAVGQQAYVDLKLREWERAVDALAHRAPRDRGPAAEQDETPEWRSASECYALERLWRTALFGGLITTSGRKARFDRSAVPDDPDGWLTLALTVTTASLVGWNDGEGIDLAVETLTMIDAEHGRPASAEEIAERWWNSPRNLWREALESDDEDDPEDDAWEPVPDDFIRRMSDEDVAWWLALFTDHALWQERDGKLRGSEFGRDVLVLLVTGLVENGLW